MIDAGQWAKRLHDEALAGRERDQEIGTGFLRRSEGVIRLAQLDAIRQCLRIAHQVMDTAAIRHRPGIGKVIDQIADLALDVKQRVVPKQGDG